MITLISLPIYPSSIKSCPLILSRYAGVGSHRYPLGFSGDTKITWKTLKYLPCFTATATNVGYTWWSHDIGGHLSGEKDDEMYVRHVQFGVLSPINRLHGTNTPTLSKEPWLFGNGTGEIVKSWLKFRHALIPYLYSASYNTHESGKGLIEPLYYEWDEPNAYKYKNQYIFGGQLLVIPVATKLNKDGYTRIKAWIPQGVWTDIFTGERYDVGKGGVEKILLRKLDSVPVLAKEGCVLPLSMDKGNSIKNPEKMEISVWNGNGEFTLYEDGKESQNDGEFFTFFNIECVEKDDMIYQTLKISSSGDKSIIPIKRMLDLKFKSIKNGKITVKEKGNVVKANKKYGDCVRLEINYNADVDYEITVESIRLTNKQRLDIHANDVLLRAEGDNDLKSRVYLDLLNAKTEEEYAKIVDDSALSQGVKLKLKEIL